MSIGASQQLNPWTIEVWIKTPMVTGWMVYWSHSLEPFARIQDVPRRCVDRYERWIASLTSRAPRVKYLDARAVRMRVGDVIAAGYSTDVLIDPNQLIHESITPPPKKAKRTRKGITRRAP